MPPRKARDDLAKAQAELKELRERTVDVAVEVDWETVEKARAEAIAGMQAKVDAAEQKRKEAEKALSDAKKEAGANAAILSRAEKAEAELAEARRQLDEGRERVPCEPEWRFGHVQRSLFPDPGAGQQNARSPLEAGKGR